MYDDLIYHLEKSLFLGLRERQYLTAKLIYEQLFAVLDATEKNPLDLLTDIAQIFKREAKRLSLMEPESEEANELQKKVNRLNNKLREMREEMSQEGADSKADLQFATVMLIVNWPKESFYSMKQFKNDNYFEEKMMHLELLK